MSGLCLYPVRWKVTIKRRVNYLCVPLSIDPSIHPMHLYFAFSISNWIHPSCIHLSYLSVSNLPTIRCSLTIHSTSKGGGAGVFEGATGHCCVLLLNAATGDWAACRRPSIVIRPSTTVQQSRNYEHIG